MYHPTRLGLLHKLNSSSFLRFKKISTDTSQVAIEEVCPKVQVGLDPNHHIHTHLLKICLQECRIFQDRRMFDEMPQRKIQAGRNCKIIHAQTMKFGFGLEGNLGNAIVDLYAKCGDIDFAWKAFNRLDKRDGCSWNSIMSMYSRCDLPEKVLRVFGLMRNANTIPNQFTFALVLSACAKLTAIGFGRKVHSDVIKTGFVLDSFCEGSLIDMYSKCDCLNDARKIFDGADNHDTVSWTSMIAGYVRVGLPEEALELSKEMQRVGVMPDQVAFVTVITAFVGLGRLDDAFDFFTQMPNPNVIAWNVMISRHAQNGFETEAINYFRDMNAAGVKPTRSTLGSVLSVIASLSALDQGQQVHSEAIKLGLDSNVYVGSSLITMYVNCQIMECARKVFDAVGEKNIVLWNAMLGGYSQSGDLVEAVKMFSSLRKCGLRPDEYTYTRILTACALLESLDIGRQLHSVIVKSNLELNLFVGNAMVNMYAKSGDLKDARRQFELIENPDNVSWNAIIAGYLHEEDEDAAFDMFRRMNSDGILPDESLSSILSACANLQALEQGKQVHCFSVKLGLDFNIYIGSSLVHMYAKCGDMEDAEKVVSGMPVQSVVSKNALIAGYIQNNNSEEAVNRFQEMQAEGLMPSKFTFASILTASSESSRLDFGRQVHCCTIKSGVLHDDVFLGVSLLGMYLKSLSNEDANKLFSEFPKRRSVVLWTCMISGHAQNGCSEEALLVFKEMRTDDALPDQATFTSVLSACAGLAALPDGREIHCLIFHTGLDLDENTCSALIDMYAKCGDVKSSVKVFEELESKQDAISWNSMIVGFGKNGYAKEALGIFDHMKNTHVRPDDVTFLGILTACSHAGLVSEGREFFDLMINHYRIQPRVDHYACMVDLLGRGGRLKEAEEFINDLPFEPDAGIWATLLAACREYGDEVLGERAAKQLIQLEPQNSSPYVLLSNIFAASKDWDGVNTVRTSMRDRGVKKLPGCSWIVVGTKTNLFVAGDKSHPNAEEIRGTLKDLTVLMKEHGYVASIDSILLDDD